MARYLSGEWLAALQGAANASTDLAEATRGVNLCVQQLVTDAPSGDAEYHVSIDDGVVEVRPGAADAPTVTFEQDYGTAVSIARGEMSAQGAFMLGLVRVRGELAMLVTHGDALAGLNDVFGTVRAETQY